MTDKNIKELRKLNKVVHGGAMAMQGARVLSNPAGAAGNISPMIGIGISGAVSDKVFNSMTKKKKKR